MTPEHWPEVVLGGLLVLYLLAMEIIDMASRLEYLEAHAPWLIRLAEKKLWHRALLIVAIALFVRAIYRLPSLTVNFPSADPGTVKSKNIEIEQLKAQVRQLTAMQTGHWTRQGIQSTYLRQDPDRETQYMSQLAYTGSTTFNPIKVKITFNQSIAGKLQAVNANFSGGVFVKSMPRGSSELTTSYATVHFCGDDLKTKIAANVLIIECSRGQMNAPDELLFGINTLKKLPTELSIVDVQRWEKD